MKRFLLFSLVFFGLFSNVVRAQTWPSGALHVLHEGSAAIRGSVGFFGPGLGVYRHLDSIPAFGSFLARGMHCDLIWVDGSGHVGIGAVQYSADSLAGVSTIATANSRQAVAYGNLPSMQVWLATTNLQPPYFRVYDYLAGQLLFSLDTFKIRGIAEGIVVKGDTAFVAINNFGADSLVAVIDLNAQDTVRLLQTGRNPNDLVIWNNQLYVQELDYTGATGLTVSVFDANTLQFIRRDTSNIPSFGGFKLVADSIVWNNSSASGGLQAYDPASGMFASAPFLPGSYYGFEAFNDPSTSQTGFFLSQTDFVSTGSVMLFANGAFRDTVQTHLSPRSLVYFHNLAGCSVVGQAEAREQQAITKVYPNPTSGIVRLALPETATAVGNIEVMDASGRLAKVAEPSEAGSQVIDLGNLPSGLYAIRIHASTGVYFAKVIKQ